MKRKSPGLRASLSKEWKELRKMLAFLSDRGKIDVFDVIIIAFAFAMFLPWILFILITLRIKRDKNNSVKKYFVYYFIIAVLAASWLYFYQIIVLFNVL